MSLPVKPFGLTVTPEPYAIERSFHVAITGDTRYWTRGRDLDEALGDWLRTHADAAGLTLVLEDGFVINEAKEGESRERLCVSESHGRFCARLASDEKLWAAADTRDAALGGWLRTHGEHIDVHPIILGGKP